MSTTMTPGDLTSILNKPADDIAPPKALPNGIYVAQVDGYEVKRLGQNNNPACEFQLTISQPLDVDPSECELPKKLRHTYWLTEDALFRFKDFLETTLQIQGGHRTLQEMLPEARGRMFRAEIVQATYVPKGKADADAVIVNNVKQVLPLE